MSGSRWIKITCKWMGSDAESMGGGLTTSEMPLVCGGHATVGSGTKIWSANLGYDTSRCLIFLLLHITSRRLQICIWHSPLQGINQYFHTYCIWRAIGLNLRYANGSLFFYTCRAQECISSESKRSHGCDATLAATSTVRGKFYSRVGLERRVKLKHLFSAKTEAELNQLSDSLDSWWTKTSHCQNWVQIQGVPWKNSTIDTPAGRRKQVNDQWSETPWMRALMELLSLRENLWAHAWIFLCSEHELMLKW